MLVARRARTLIVMLLIALVGAGLAPAPLAQAATPAGGFVAVTPARVLDTREGNGGSGPVPTGRTLTVQVAGRGGVPATGAGAVMLNVTVTQATAGGFLTVHPGGTAAPTASNLNYAAGQTVPNQVLVKLAADGTIALTPTGSGTVQLIADVAGYTVAGTPTAPGTMVAQAPRRVLDTRSGVGAPTGLVRGETALTLQVAGRAGVPTAGVAAVIMNVTVTQTAGGGFVTAYPFASHPPTASNLNFGGGQTVANLVTVRLSDDGKVNLGVTGASTHLIADVAGYVLAGTPSGAGAVLSVDPDRLLDTRAGIGAAQASVPAGGTVELALTGVNGLPLGAYGAAILNVTVTQPTSNGFLTVYPSGGTAPTASNLNFARGQTVANLVTVAIGADGKVALRNTSAGSVHVIADAAAFVLGPVAIPRASSSTPIQGYNSSSDAAAGTGVSFVLPPGTYVVYKTEAGMANLTQHPGQPGVWVNPALYDKRPSSPDPTLTKYSNVQIDWSHEYPEDGHFAYPELGGVYRYPDGKIHLTFDLGYEYNDLTVTVLNKLRAKGVHATFYVTGNYLQERPDLVKRMLADGHVVANHSMNHPNTVQLMATGLKPAFDDFRAWEEQYKSVTGQYPDLWKYRPPSGIFSERVIAMAYTLGYVSELYDVALYDYDTDNQLSAETTMTRLRNQTSAGSMVLLHTVSTTNAQVLDQYLDYCRSKGWTFAEP